MISSVNVTKSAMVTFIFCAVKDTLPMESTNVTQLFKKQE